MATFTRKAILETFDSLLKEYPFDKITVSMVYRRCGISHNTFYYHFEDIYGLLEAWLEEKFRELFSNSKPYREKIRDLLLSCIENKETINHLFECLSRGLIELYFYRESEHLFEPSLFSIPGTEELTKEQFKTILQFSSDVFFGRLIRFIWSGMTDDVEEVSSELEHFLTTYVNAI